MTHPGIVHDSGEGPAPIVPPAPLPDSAGEQDVLGLRIGAALIDVALLAGLFTILSAAVGQTTVSGEGFNVSLSGLWLVVFLAAALGYYFVLEAWAGQTLGKRLLGLRVLRPDGTRPSVGAVALRTLLRVVDWLPLLYLAGFITMLATGTRRQRIGDLVARTALARALPVRHRGLALVPLVIVMLAAIALPVYRATSGGGTQTYRGHGVSFDYPAGWQEGTASAASGSLWKTTFGPGTGADLIAVEADRMWIPIGAGNLAEASSQLEPDVRRFFAQEGGAMQAGSQQITVGGLPALRFRGTGTEPDGTVIGNTLVFAFNGTTEYAINCQHTRANAGEVERACSQVMRTFKASSPPPAPAGTQSYRAHGVSFAYPAVLQEGTLGDHIGNGPQLWAASFALDTQDWIGIGADRLPAPVTAARLAAFTPAADKAARRFFGQVGGVVQAGPQQTTVGGLPALQFRGTMTSQGIAFKVTLVFAFDGTTQYFLYCAQTRAGAGQMERACGQVMRTFKVSKAT